MLIYNIELDYTIFPERLTLFHTNFDKHLSAVLLRKFYTIAIAESLVYEKSIGKALTVNWMRICTWWFVTNNYKAANGEVILPWLSQL